MESVLSALLQKSILNVISPPYSQLVVVLEAIESCMYPHVSRDLLQLGFLSDSQSLN